MTGSSNPRPIRRLSPALKRRFRIAWRLMPDVVQEALHPYVIRVEERATLAGAEIRVGGQVVATSDVDAQGRAMIAYIDGRMYGAVLLRSDTAQIPEGPAVAIICHELAHCLQHLDCGEREWLANESETELSAWFQALAWLTFHAQRYERHYEGLDEAISYGLGCVDELGDAWGAERRRGRRSD
ncbi:MAG: hypothetical protein ABW277_19935 [Longimicrobiaceae bacterium]